MLQTWANRLVKSPKRRHTLLAKKAAPWAAVLRTLQGANLRTACNLTAIFPETIQLNVQFNPVLVPNLGVTVQAKLNETTYAKIAIYIGEVGAAHKFGRCAAVNLTLKTPLEGPVFTPINEGELIWSKPFLHQTHPVLETLSVNEHHKLVNAETGRVHIYPYAGHFSKHSADTGESLFFVVNGGNETRTSVSVLTQAQLNEKGISLSNLPARYQLIHSTANATELRQSVNSLSACVNAGDIQLNLSTLCGSETWHHAYQSTHIQRTPGTLNGVLTLKRVGVVFKQEA